MIIQLSSLTNANFSGMLTYEQSFQANQLNNAMLDLGEVYEIAEVWLNGQDVGVKLWSNKVQLFLCNKESWTFGCPDI